MGSFSIWHWLIVLFSLTIFVVPLWRILPRAGVSKWVAVFGVLPLVAVILWWMLAFMRWPGDLEKSANND